MLWKLKFIGNSEREKFFKYKCPREKKFFKIFVEKTEYFILKSDRKPFLYWSESTCFGQLIHYIFFIIIRILKYFYKCCIIQKHIFPVTTCLVFRFLFKKIEKNGPKTKIIFDITFCDVHPLLVFLTLHYQTLENYYYLF